MPPTSAITRPLERLVALVGQAAAWTLLAVVALQSAILVARRLGFTSIVAGETVTLLAVPVTLLTIPWVLQRNAHVAADALSERLPPRVARLIEQGRARPPRPALRAGPRLALRPLCLERLRER